jgi:hypothetical protein
MVTSHRTKVSSDDDDEGDDYDEGDEEDYDDEEVDDDVNDDVLSWISYVIMFH